ncbi:MAG: hypothetical protein V4563_15905 [Pseudomonadota bacterium]
MKLTLTIQMDNAAFDDGADGLFEVARILAKLADGLRDGIASSSLFDVNGNKVGKFEIK